MKIINPEIQVEQYNPIKIMRNIERAMRNCYKSEDKMTEDSYNKLLKMAVVSGHGSVMEHEKITVKITCDVGHYKDLCRHRAGTAFSIESTRYCNYSKGKFGNELKFIKPVFYTDSWQEKEFGGDDIRDLEDGNEYKSYLWYDCMDDIERKYMALSQAGATPDELRMILPHSTAADVVMTCNIREWRHVLTLRCSKQAHPSIRQTLIPLLLKFKKDMPVLFEDIPYDETFPKEKYAKISELEELG